MAGKRREPAPDGFALGERPSYRVLAYGVLVGTRAFAAYGPLLGFRAPLTARTQDLDVALGRGLEIALPRNEEGDLPARLAETVPPFLPVPDLDPRRLSTSFKVRGRELRIDFLTPRRRGDAERAVPIPAYGLSAWPLELLDFLVEGALAAVVSGSRPVLVRVPEPARFALHKLWLAGERSSQEATRARKDLAQAQALLEVLAEERPGDLTRAAVELLRRPRAAARVRGQAKRLPSELAASVLATLRL